MTTRSSITGLAAILAAALVGCVSTVESGPANPPIRLSGKVLVAPFTNATDDDNAGRAFADLVATELAARGLDVQILPPKPADELGETKPYSDSELAAAAKKAGVSGIVRGTAIEFRYKTDLDGDPAAGLYVEVLDPSARSPLWHATAARTGLVYAELRGIKNPQCRMNT